MNVKDSVFVICVEAIIFLLLYNLHECAFKTFKTGERTFNKVSKMVIKEVLTEHMWQTELLKT